MFVSAVIASSTQSSGVHDEVPAKATSHHQSGYPTHCVKFHYQNCNKNTPANSYLHSARLISM